MPSHESEQTVKTNHNGIRRVARKALLQLLEPLIGFVLDTGLSTQELHSILRETAVRSVAAKQLGTSRRVNISGIAASTGIPRAEISKILKSNLESPSQVADRQQQSTNRVLSAWHQHPRFNTPSGKPADLKLYGRGATFETLVRNNGRGIPTRAMLDELTRAGAAEVLPSGLIRAKTSVVVDRGVTVRAVRSFGERAADLLSTMLQNMRNPENHRFIASVSTTNISRIEIPLFRKEIATKGADFLADINDSLSRQAPFKVGKQQLAQASRVSVTLFYHETVRKTKSSKVSIKKRQNFRRNG